jgi:hypothetical protein
MRPNDLGNKLPDAANPSESIAEGSDADAISEDQLAVRQYLNSDVFRRACQQTDLLHTRDNSATTRDSISTTVLIRQDDWAFPMSRRQSLFRALGFQAVLLCLIAGMLPVMVEVLQWFDIPSSPRFASIALLSQTLVFPVIISFAFTVVSVSLWHGSIVIRFAVAAASGLAALSVFAGSLAFVFFLEGTSQSIVEVLNYVAAPLFCSFVAVMFLVLFVQLFTSWTLIEAKVSGDQVTKTGMKSMIELTAVSAICCVALTKIDLLGDAPVLLGFAFLGSISGLVALSIIAHHLRRRIQGECVRAKPWNRVLPIALALAFAIIFNGMNAIQEFGNQIRFGEGVLIAVLSIYGAAIIYAIGLAHAYLFKICGWHFVSRKSATS